MSSLCGFVVLISWAALSFPCFAQTAERQVPEEAFFDPAPDDYVPRRVPRGEVHLFPYYSTLFDARHAAYVYTPPKYQQDQTATYPTLYLLHGSGGGDETSWTREGHAHVILDELIADENIDPMVLVMVRGTDMYEEQELFIRSVVEELIPAIEGGFRTIRDPDYRAIAGLSMGGRQSAVIAFRHLSMFTYIGGFSPSGTIRGMGFQDGQEDAINKHIKLFWIACGIEDEYVWESVQQVHQQFSEIGVRHEFVSHPGNHTWPSWRFDLYTFARRIFKE